MSAKARQAADPNRPARRRLAPLKRLNRFLLRYPVRLALTLLFLLVSALITLAIPLLAGDLIDQGFITRNLDVVTQYGWLILVMALVMAAASGARFYFVSILGERVITDLRRAVFDHLLTLDARFYDANRVGELTSRLTGDVSTIRTAISSTLSLALRNFVLIIGAVVLMILTSPYLALAVIVALPVIIIPIIAISRRFRQMSRRTQDIVADMSAMATEMLGAHRTVKSFTQEDEQSRLYGERNEISYAAEATRIRARALLLGTVLFLAAACLLAMVWWGARAVFEGTVSAGQLAQFMIYALMAANALSALSETWGTLQIVAGSTERLMELLDTRPTLPLRQPPLPLPQPPLGTVDFDKVSFAYANRDDENVLTDLSFTVARGEAVALVGASGAGKSTVFALAERFYDVSAGVVRVDGMDVRDVDPKALRQRFAYVEQDPVIFAGTVGDNIRFGKPDATQADIEAAARAALVHDFVSELPRGYDTIVGERGVMLSGGQKQRLAIARALLKDAPILLLDEATSALDAQSERLVQLALERLMQGRTTLVIAHRLATIRDVDRILVFDRGQIIDQGTHDELVAKGGRYAELARLQFGMEQAAE